MYKDLFILSDVCSVYCRSLMGFGASMSDMSYRLNASNRILCSLILPYPSQHKTKVDTTPNPLKTTTVQALTAITCQATKARRDYLEAFTAHAKI